MVKEGMHGAELAVTGLWSKIIYIYTGGRNPTYYHIFTASILKFLTVCLCLSICLTLIQGKMAHTNATISHSQHIIIWLKCQGHVYEIKTGET